MNLGSLWIFTFVVLATNIKSGASDDYEKLQKTFCQECRAILIRFDCRISCEKVLKRFLLSFIGMISEHMVAPKESSLVEAGYYDDYFDVTLFPNQPIIDNALFWTGTKLVAKKLVAAGANVTTYDSIFGTHIIEDLRAREDVIKWCSSPDRSVLLNENCLTFQPVYVFWAEAARRLARNVVGKTYYLTADGYFAEISIYNEQVLSTLLKRRSMCTGINVINIIPKDSKTRCGSGRLSKLEKAVNGTLNYRCFDVYGYHYQPSVQLIQCISDLIDDLSEGICPSVEAHKHVYSNLHFSLVKC